ncbi:MAG: DNA polymerase III subunit chi [Giesbergeria sp.]|nr:DNA polymerase III subunit chi [Giesbergeria sp.]
MTEVAFHFNAPDKLAYACRFARKMLRSGHPLVITAPAPTLEVLSARLWALAPPEFLAHARADSPAQVLDASPILLLTDPSHAGLQQRQCQVLLNLGDQVPAGFEQFARLVEVVSAHDEIDRQQARLRWRDYTQRGYAIVRHDLVLKN